MAQLTTMLLFGTPMLPFMKKTVELTKVSVEDREETKKLQWYRPDVRNVLFFNGCQPTLGVDKGTKFIEELISRLGNMMTSSPTNSLWFPTCLYQLRSEAEKSLNFEIKHDTTLK